jgi:hypothetical protein
MARGRPRKDSPDVLTKSAEFVGWALGGLEREIAQTRERLSALTEHAVKLRSTISKRKAAAPSAERQGTPERLEKQPVGRRQRRRQMSPEARQRISEMMKKRWAQRRKAKG